MELAFIVLFAYLQKIKREKLKKAAETVAETAKTSMPATLK
jgi:hypothetical protein